MLIFAGSTLLAFCVLPRFLLHWIFIMQERHLSFWARVQLAFRLLGDGELATRAAALTEPSPAPSAVPPERQHAPALALLAALQREGRFVDFLQEDVGSFSDAEVGGAARVVHAGCRKVLSSALTLEPAWPGEEGSRVTVPAGFDAQRIRLTGAVLGQPPFKGSLKHHGWVASDVRLPTVSEALDPRILAPAEVEL
jgi:hypothetical protein